MKFLTLGFGIDGLPARPPKPFADINLSLPAEEQSVETAVKEGMQMSSAECQSENCLVLGTAWLSNQETTFLFETEAKMPAFFTANPNSESFQEP